MDAANYFDNAATTQLDPLALAEMLPFLGTDFGNASSIHAYGQRAKTAVELARARVAGLFGCSPEEIVFTSGATESNNWVLQSFQDVIVSPFEHSSVAEVAENLSYRTFENDGYELLEESELELASVMSVNNETGAILSPPPGQFKLHRDMTQSFGKVPVLLVGVDYASVSGHKLHGPQGVGALFIRNADPLEPLLYGGGQEGALRGGTLNVAGIVGFGAACAIAGDQMPDRLAHVESLRTTALETLAKVPDWRVNESNQNSPYILSLSFLGVEGETLVIEADAQGFAISSGAACSTGSTEPSRVLTALEIEPEWLRGTIRVSFSKGNTVDTTAALSKVLSETVTNLRAYGK